MVRPWHRWCHEAGGLPCSAVEPHQCWSGAAWLRCRGCGGGWLCQPWTPGGFIGKPWEFLCWTMMNSGELWGIINSNLVGALIGIFYFPNIYRWLVNKFFRGVETSNQLWSFCYSSTTNFADASLVGTPIHMLRLMEWYNQWTGEYNQHTFGYIRSVCPYACRMRAGYKGVRSLCGSLLGSEINNEGNKNIHVATFSTFCVGPLTFYVHSESMDFTL